MNIANPLPAVGARVRMISENSNWSLGEKGTVIAVTLDRFGVVFDGREDDYTVFAADCEVVVA